MIWVGYGSVSAHSRSFSSAVRPEPYYSRTTAALQPHYSRTTDSLQTSLRAHYSRTTAALRISLQPRYSRITPALQLHYNSTTTPLQFRYNPATHHQDQELQPSDRLRKFSTRPLRVSFGYVCYISAVRNFEEESDIQQRRPASD